MCNDGGPNHRLTWEPISKPVCAWYNYRLYRKHEHQFSSEHTLIQTPKKSDHQCRCNVEEKSKRWRSNNPKTNICPYESGYFSFNLEFQARINEQKYVGKGSQHVSIDSSVNVNVREARTTRYELFGIMYIKRQGKYIRSSFLWTVHLKRSSSGLNLFRGLPSLRFYSHRFHSLDVDTDMFSWNLTWCWKLILFHCSFCYF